MPREGRREYLFCSSLATSSFSVFYIWKAIVKYVVLSIIKLWSLLPAFPHMILNTFGYLSIRSQCHAIAEYFIYTVVYDS